MFKNHLKIVWRNIVRHRGIAFLNIAGLAFGMAICLLIVQWVRDESSYDGFHQNIDRLYRLVELQRYTDGTDFPVAATPAPAGPAFKKTYPEIQESARVVLGTNVLASSSPVRTFYEPYVLFADPSFLEVFTFPLVKGDPKTALGDIGSILLTETAARTHFGGEDPIGRTMTLYGRLALRVTGVLRDIPATSHLRFGMLAHFDQLSKSLGFRVENWFNNSYYTYLLVRPGTDVGRLGNRLRDHLRTFDPDNKTQFFLQPVKDIHLKSRFAIDLYGQTDDRSAYIVAFSAVAGLILLIACINFMNLATARSGIRAKEIGVRKAVGANRRNVIRQFFLESFVHALLAGVSALFLIGCALPAFNRLTRKSIALAEFLQGSSPLLFLGIVLAAGLVAGAYPALFMSSFHPAAALKDRGYAGRGSASFRKALVVVQFALTVVFISGTIIVARQMDFVRRKDLGYNKERVVTFRLRQGLGANYAAFKNDLLRRPEFRNVARSSDIPTFTVSSAAGFRWEGQKEGDVVLLHTYAVDHDFVETLGLEMAAGRDFSPEFPSDATSAFVINESAARLLGMADPVGKWIDYFDDKRTIIGVVKDFHFKSLHKTIEPLMLRILPARDRFVLVRVGPGPLTESLAALRKVYDKYENTFPFEPAFLDQSLEALYQTDRRTGSLFRFFTSLAVLISCLGLFGLASFLIERRNKEIGIRKVLGADLPEIVFLLTRDFLKWVAAAALIGAPAAYLVMSRWLRGFAYRTAIGPDILILAGGLALGIAFLTVIAHSIRAAAAHPADSLRRE